MSSTVGGSDGKPPAVCGGHSGDPQNSAAVAERDLNAGQSGGGKNLAITKPAHLRNWRSCGGENRLSENKHMKLLHVQKIRRIILLRIQTFEIKV